MEASSCSDERQVIGTTTPNSPGSIPNVSAIPNSSSIFRSGRSPRSQRPTVCGSTPSSSATCSWVQPRCSRCFLSILPDDYETISQQSLEEMQQADFMATTQLLTVWGGKLGRY